MDNANMDTDPIISVSDTWMSFAGKTAGQPVHVLERVNLHRASGRICLHRRPVRLRQIHAAQHPRRLSQETRGEVRVEGAPVTGPDPGRIFVFQENGVFPVAHRRAEHRLRSALAAGRGARRTRHALHRHGGPDRLRELLSARTLRRHAAARGDRPRPRGRRARALHGRTVRRARLPHPSEDARRSHPHLAGGEEDHPLRHARHRGGRATRRPRPRDDQAARPRFSRGSHASICPARAISIRPAISKPATASSPSWAWTPTAAGPGPDVYHFSRRRKATISRNAAMAAKPIRFPSGLAGRSGQNPHPSPSAAKLDTQNGIRNSRKVCQ